MKFRHINCTFWSLIADYIVVSIAYALRRGISSEAVTMLKSIERVFILINEKQQIAVNRDAHNHFHTVVGVASSLVREKLLRFSLMFFHCLHGPTNKFEKKEILNKRF